MNKTFSVIIPTYYRNDFLVRAVNSVLSQTYRDFEIIIVDDSKDRHAEKTVFELQKNTKSVIRYFSSGGIKQGGARNLGFKNAKGDLIAILDDDDLWVANKLEIEFNTLKKYNFNVIVYGGRTLHNVEGDKIDEYLPKYTLLAPQMIKLFNFVAFPALAFRKSVFDKAGYLDATLSTHEDWDFLNRLALHYKFIPIKKVLAQIYKHDNNRDKEHFNVWESDKLKVMARFKKEWNMITYILFFFKSEIII